MPGIYYILLCLFLPVLWGIFSAWLFDRWQARASSDTLQNARKQEEEDSEMYYI